MPPMDIVNLGMNENDMGKDLTVAFIGRTRVTRWWVFVTLKNP